MERRPGAMAGEIPKRHVDRRERGRADAAWCQRVDRLGETRHHADDGSGILPDEPGNQFILQERENGRPAGANRVAEAYPASIGAIPELDDWELERVELLNRIAARRIDRNADQSRLRADDRTPTI